MNDKNPITHSMIGFLLAPYLLSPIGHFCPFEQNALKIPAFCNTFQSIKTLNAML